MGDRKSYIVTIGGLPHTMELNDEDAKRYGGSAVLATKQQPAPANKAAVKPRNKSRED